MQKLRVKISSMGGLSRRESGSSETGQTAGAPAEFQAAKSENSAQLFTTQSLFVRLARPPRTAPGPSSQNSVAPALAAFCMQSSQSTDETTCLTKAARISSGALTVWPVVF